eukprot:TRINITY_DN3292_c0_g1_i1.p1 TRINITY_DN3292_c0_g1~~TRINITY_DN3292_c0_g1_i1.p1  ORF type:complete len:279 (+),score=85.13 TRINITY_DN3292_c0_g1_i1:59-895(+)
MQDPALDPPSPPSFPQQYAPSYISNNHHHIHQNGPNSPPHLPNLANLANNDPQRLHYDDLDRSHLPPPDQPDPSMPQVGLPNDMMLHNRGGIQEIDINKIMNDNADLLRANKQLIIRNLQLERILAEYHQQNKAFHVFHDAALTFFEEFQISEALEDMELSDINQDPDYGVPLDMSGGQQAHQPHHMSNANGISTPSTKKRKNDDSNMTFYNPARKKKQPLWTPEEDSIFESRYNEFGKRWSVIHQAFPNKTREKVQSHGQDLIKIKKLEDQPTSKSH